MLAYMDLPCEKCEIESCWKWDTRMLRLLGVYLIANVAQEGPVPGLRAGPMHLKLRQRLNDGIFQHANYRY